MQNQKNIDLEMENEEEEDADQQEITKHGTWSEQLIKATKKGDIEWVKRSLDKKADINYEDKIQKWNALIWASCQNNADIVRLLISRGAAQQYVKTNESQGVGNEQKKVKQGQINMQIRQTPLQWACFKGNLLIVWLLLKVGCSWQDVDAFGNNCAHLAASGGNLKTFQTLLMSGIDVNGRNSRNHQVLELAADHEISTLIKQHKQALKCYRSKQPFGDEERKFWCSTCKNFFCEKEYKIEWTWETQKSTEMQRLDGKCHQCWANIQMHTDQLVLKMSNYDHKQLTDQLNEIKQNNIEIDLKIHLDAQILQEQLRTQNIISSDLDKLKTVDNYQTILKSVFLIEQSLKDAQVRGVQLDENIVERAHKEKDRLVAERNLREKLDNIDSGNCSPQEVKILTDLMKDAKDKHVAQVYMDEAEKLRDKMSRSIETKDIFQMFVQYPPRVDWRPCVRWDHKLKKAIDPETQKPPDLKKFIAPKKKSKKNQLPTYPEWAVVTLDLEQQIKRIQELLKCAKELDLDEKFETEAQVQIQEMKKQLVYRKQLDTEKQLIDDIVEAQKQQKQ